MQNFDLTYTFSVVCTCIYKRVFGAIPRFVPGAQFPPPVLNMFFFLVFIVFLDLFRLILV